MSQPKEIQSSACLSVIMLNNHLLYMYVAIIVLFKFLYALGHFSFVIATFGLLQQGYFLKFQVETLFYIFYRCISLFDLS